MINKEINTRYNLTIPRDLKRDLESLKLDKQSLNDLIITILTNYKEQKA